MDATRLIPLSLYLDESIEGQYTMLMLVCIWGASSRLVDQQLAEGADRLRDKLGGATSTVPAGRYPDRAVYESRMHRNGPEGRQGARNVLKYRLMNDTLLRSVGNALLRKVRYPVIIRQRQRNKGGNHAGHS